MLWQEITSVEFARSVKEDGVCLLPIGCLERHSDHLPLGTDLYIAHEQSRLAAEIEPAIVFPQYYFGQIYEARCYPGTITLSPDLLLKVLGELVDEIARNGLKKIILVNGHGGNRHMLRYFCQTLLASRKDYQVYFYEGRYSETQLEEINAFKETDFGEHAEEEETSMILAMNPAWAKMDQIGEPARPLGRMTDHLDNLYNGFHWYADHPEHYSGDARPATAEKGRRLFEMKVENLVNFIKQVKADEVMPALGQEFYNRVDNLMK